MAGALGVLMALVGFSVTARALADNSFLTHLATGRFILDTGAVPTTDPYSLSPGADWTVQSWLPSVVYAMVEGLGGGGGLRILNGLLGSALAVLLWRLTGPARQVIPRVALTLAPALLGTVFWSSRPLLFGLVAMAATLVIWRENRSGWPLIPLMWVWVNSHGSFPLLFVFLALAAVGRAWDERRRPRVELRLLGWAAIGLMVATLNPLGWRLLTFPFGLLARREALVDVVEWSPPSFTHWTEYLFLGYLGLIVVAATRRPQWGELLPAIAFMATGLLAIRNFNMAALVVTAALAPALAGMLGREDGTEPMPVARAVSAVGWAGLAAALVATVAGPGFRLGPYPEAEVADLHDRGLIANREVTVLHREAVGNYLAFRFGPDAASFVDDRFDLHPIGLVEDHRRLVNGVEVGEIISRHSPDVVVWETDSAVARFVQSDEDWEVLSADEDWTVACRIGSDEISACRQP